MNRLAGCGTVGACAVVWALLCGGCRSAGPPAVPVTQPARVTVEEIDRAIQRGVDYLYSQQTNGDWDSGVQPAPNDGERTAVAVLAILAAGEDVQDPRLKLALPSVWDAPRSFPLAAAMKLQVAMNDAHDPRNMAPRRNSLGGFLVKAAAGPGPARGVVPEIVGYGVADPIGSAEAVAAVEAWDGAPPQFFDDVGKALLSARAADGGWMPGLLPTAEGLPRANRLVTTAAAARAILMAYYRNPGPSVREFGPASEAMEWIADRIKTEPLDCFGWYQIGRLGTLTGLKRIGGVDWAQAGTSQLLEMQNKDGGWGRAGMASNVTDTAWAILFLSQNRSPLIVSKLRYQIDGTPARWNNRPRDIANVLKFCGDALCGRELRFQTVTLDCAADLADGPLLYISGDQALHFTAEEERTLKEYVLSGGLIVGNADECSKDFADSFLKLGARLFPESDFRALPKEHALFVRQQYPRASWRTPPSLLGLSNGVREFMVLLPGDCAQAWQANTLRTKQEQFQVFQDIWQYGWHTKLGRGPGAAGLQPKDRDPSIHATHTIRLARLEYSGNWDPEPGGWRRLAVWLRNTYRTDLVVESVRLGPGSAGVPARSGNAADDGRAPRKLIGNFAVAHLTGTGKLNLTEAHGRELVQFVENGGTLIIDAAGGDSDFAASAEAMLAGLWPKAQLALVDMADPIYREALASGAKPFRSYARTVAADPKRPEVKALAIGGRNAVIFSRWDISSALVGHDFDGIAGYEPRYGTELMSGILLRATGK